MIDLRMYDVDIEEHIVKEYGHLTKEEQGRVRYRLHNIVREAKPGNHFWQLCEEEFGWNGDYSPADHGMNWGDNN